MKKLILRLMIVGLRYRLETLLQKSRYNLQNDEVQNCSILLDKYIFACQRIYSQS